MTIAIIVLSAALAAALLRILCTGRGIRRAARELNAIAKEDTNALLTAANANKSLTALTQSINIMLKRNRRVLFEKVRAEAELKRAVTNISHDLRTPLTSALGFLQMMESAGLSEETRTRYLSTVKNRLGALAAQMESLFEFAKIMEGSVTLNAQSVNASALLREALSAAYPELSARHFEVEARIPDAPVFFYCDKDALLRVFQNLIKNACAHGREYLCVTLTENTAAFANKADRLDELDTRQMFDRFYTADTARTGKNAGLGLAIVKELATLMGGQLSARVDGAMLVITLSFT